MAWENRDYYREQRPGGFGGGGGGRGGLWRIYQWLNASFPIGRYFGINVRVHITFLLLVFFELLRTPDALWTLRWTGLLFVSVLIHEFGHSLACRRVGGTSNEILMWPLGGLAFTSPPRNWWAHFVTTAWGPLVNVIVAAACYVALFIWLGEPVVTLNPFAESFHFYLDGLPGLIRDLFVVNYGLVLFNLCLLFYPFDGGRLVQEVLWSQVGYAKSMSWATTMGMVGAGAAAAVGVMQGNFLLVLIAVFGFMTCLQQQQALRYAGAEEVYDPGYYSGGEPGPGNTRKGWFAQRREAASQKHRERQRAAAAAEEAEVDRILDKVSQQGLHSLTAREKKALQRSTDRKNRAR